MLKWYSTRIFMTWKSVCDLLLNEEGSSKESENMSLFVWKIDEYIQAESGLGINVCKAFSGAIYVWWDNGCI